MIAPFLTDAGIGSLDEWHFQIGHYTENASICLGSKMTV